MPVPAGTVLVVDDEPMVRRSFKHLLEDMGYQVMVADGGAAALEIYEANLHQIDVVLLDLSMPLMDGVECCARLKSINQDVRVVFCSGHTRGEAAERLLRGGRHGLLPKPCTVAELAAALTAAVPTQRTKRRAPSG
jgi:CheY-like chemotaxis protein